MPSLLYVLIGANRADFSTISRIVNSLMQSGIPRMVKYRKLVLFERRVAIGDFSTGGRLSYKFTRIERVKYGFASVGSLNLRNGLKRANLSKQESGSA